MDKEKTTIPIRTVRRGKKRETEDIGKIGYF